MEDPAGEEGRWGMTLFERAGTLVAALLVFAFGAGPIWRHAWSPDASILWSYAVIPALVLVLLGRRHALRLGPFLAESLVLSVFKFGITAIVMIGFWSFSKPPSPASGRAGVVQGTKKRGISSNERESGAAVDAARLAAARHVRVGDGRFAPNEIPVAGARDLVFLSSDGSLHAVEALSAEGAILRNVPALGSGAPAFLPLEEIPGGVSLRCAIHPLETAAISR